MISSNYCSHHQSPSASSESASDTLNTFRRAQRSKKGNQTDTAHIDARRPEREPRRADMTTDAQRAIAKTLNESQISLATHKKGAKTLAKTRSEDPETFLPTFCNAILPVLLEYKVRGWMYASASRCVGVTKTTSCTQSEPDWVSFQRIDVDEALKMCF